MIGIVSKMKYDKLQKEHDALKKYFIINDLSDLDLIQLEYFRKKYTEELGSVVGKIQDINNSLLK